MKVQEIIDELRLELDHCRMLEIEQVSIDRFEQLILNIERIAKATPEDVTREAFALELYRGKMQDWVNKRDIKRRRAEQMPGHTISTGATALKFILGINGGAAVALLALTGAIAKADVVRVPGGLLDALSLFSAGVFIAAIGAGAAYVAQAGYGGEFGARSRTASKWGFLSAVTASVIALICFLVAVGFAADGLGSLGTP